MAKRTYGRLSTFLVLAVALGIWTGCGDDGVAPAPTGLAPERTGSLEVTTTTVGKDSDPDGYTFTVDGGSERAIDVKDVVTIEEVPAGTHQVVLEGLAPACATADGTNPTSVIVTSGETASVTFDVVCQEALEDQIAFTSQVDSHPEIFVMDSDGSNQFRLTRSPNGARDPAVSPDGNRILFVSDRDGNEEIYLMNANGSGVERLTDDPGRDIRARWSPDGSRIAFSSSRDDTPGLDVFVMNADGSAPVNLTGESQGTAATWSPDGSKVAFTSARTGEFEIFVMNADGSNPVNVTNDPERSDYSPAWSPDGQRIAYATIGTGRAEIYVMDVDGSNRTNLTNHPAIDERPTWSPDGTKIVFTTYRTGGGEVFVMNADGSQQRNVSNRPDAADEVGFPQGWR